MGMAKSTSALATPLREQLDRLVAFEPAGADEPVISLYLDMRADQHGRSQYDAFLRKTFTERSAALHGDARKSFDRDVERIKAYLDEEREASTNGIAIFACAARDDFFEAVQLNAPIEQHWLFLGSVPHLYPLARVNDQWPRYAAVVVDTNSARLFVFSLGGTEARHEIRNQKTRKTSMGGWSQARYQRHIENFHVAHMKEVAALLERVVREEQITQVIVACDDVARPLLMEQLPQDVASLVIDVVSLDQKVPEHEVLSETLTTLRERDAGTDAEHVQALLDAWQGSGLGVVGPADTLTALSMGQVEELLIAAAPEQIEPAAGLPADEAAGAVEVATTAATADTERLTLANELITRAQQQSARIRFIEDPDLLSDVGGVGAILRFKIEPAGQSQS